MRVDRNSRALLLGLTATLLVVGGCLLAYPPGSVLYDEASGRKLAIVGRRVVALPTIIRHILLATAQLSVLPALLFFLIRRRQRPESQPVRLAWLLYLSWGILLAGWLFGSDWYPPANLD